MENPWFPASLHTHTHTHSYANQWSSFVRKRKKSRTSASARSQWPARGAPSRKGESHQLTSGLALTPPLPSECSACHSYIVHVTVYTHIMIWVYTTCIHVWVYTVPFFSFYVRYTCTCTQSLLLKKLITVKSRINNLTQCPFYSNFQFLCTWSLLLKILVTVKAES